MLQNSALQSEVMSDSKTEASRVHVQESSNSRLTSLNFCIKKSGSSTRYDVTQCLHRDRRVCKLSKECFASFSAKRLFIIVYKTPSGTRQGAPVHWVLDARYPGTPVQHQCMSLNRR